MFGEETYVSKVRYLGINLFFDDVILKDWVAVGKCSVWECVETHSTNKQDYDRDENYAKRVYFNEKLKVWTGGHKKHYEKDDHTSPAVTELTPIRC